MRVEIKMKLPSLNEYINVCRANRFRAGSYVKGIEDQIGWFLTGLPVYHNPIWIHFHWIEQNRKRDLDNIAFAKKFILDAMVKMKKIKDDSSKYVAGFTDTFDYGKETKVILYIDEEMDWNDTK